MRNHASNRILSPWLLGAGLLLLAGSRGASGAAEEATLSSDQMELVNNGQKTIFTGHVILKRPPYRLKADRMTRTQPGDVVEAQGHIRINWTGDEGQTTEAFGEYARYDPATEIAELWTVPGRKITVKWKNPKGAGDFISERALLNLVAKRASLVNQVTGHIIPAP